MYIPLSDIPSLFNASFKMTPELLEKPAHFSFDTAGALALVGGYDAMSAMATVHVYKGRRWLGWYNTPGSFQLFKRLMSFARSTPQTESFSKNVHTDPRTLFKSEGTCKGPKFRAAHSGTVMEETGYLARLFMKECAAWGSEGKVIPGRRTQAVGITIANLDYEPASEICPTRTGASAVVLAGVPIAASLGTCVLCAVSGDWYASWLILIGILASGVSCLILGSADFVFTHPIPAKGSPAGDGILGTDRDIILLKGTEAAVNSITRGDFTLRFSSKAHHGLVRWCSFLFFFQCVTQLLLMSQASLFGQTMFLLSLGISALYNKWLSSVDKEKIHSKVLFDQVLGSPRIRKYTLGTRTSAVVFTLLVLRPQDPKALLNELLPNDTNVWRKWKETMLERLCHSNDLSFQFGDKIGGPDAFTQQEEDLLAVLYEDARTGYNGYKDYIQTGSL